MAHVTTQMDFDTKAIAAWVRARRAEGFAPAVIVGVPGVADPQKLMSIAARIGVKDAKRFLVKNLRFVTGLAKSGGFYKPTGFVEGIAPLLADPAANVTGFHLYTFNAVEATEGWRRAILEELTRGDLRVTREELARRRSPGSRTVWPTPSRRRRHADAARRVGRRRDRPPPDRRGAAVWQVRFVEVLTLDDPHWGWTGAGPGARPGGRALDDIVAAFAAVRAETVATVARFDDDGWARSGTHATYGVLDVAGLLRLAVDHDEEHLRGIVTPGLSCRASAHRFVTRRWCGPVWSVWFGVVWGSRRVVRTYLSPPGPPGMLRGRTHEGSRTPTDTVSTTERDVDRPAVTGRTTRLRPGSLPPHS